MSEQSPDGAWGSGWSGPPPPAPPKRRRTWPWILLVVVLLLVGGCVAVIALVVGEVAEESDRKARVRYEVTGTARDVTITYSTWRDGDVSISQLVSRRLPWTKEVEATGLLKDGTLTVTLGDAGGTATCSVTVDGGAPRTASASGAFTTAVCDAF